MIITDLHVDIKKLMIIFKLLIKKGDQNEQLRSQQIKLCKRR